MHAVIPSFFAVIIVVLSVLLGPLRLTEGKPTIYMKNENDKLEPVLLPVSSTVIPIPIGYYQQVKVGVGVHNEKLTKQKIKLTKPSGPTKLITGGTMSHSSATTSSRNSEQIELMQNLFEEILQIQKENKQTDENMIRVQEIIQESSKVVENSTSANEMIVDAKILQTGTNYVSCNVNSLNTNLTSFSESKYISGLLSYIENSNQLVPLGKEWDCLGHVTYKMLKKSHPVTFMLGTFTLEPPPVKEQAKIERKQLKRALENKKEVLSKMIEKEKPLETGSDIYDHILKCLVRQFKKNEKKPVSYFSFIIDPTDYWRTIENIFHFAFLVRDGSVKMSLENRLPVIEPVLKNSEEKIGRKSCNYQFCFRLSVQEWEQCIERFEILSSSIPPFVKKT